MKLRVLNRVWMALALIALASLVMPTGALAEEADSASDSGISTEPDPWEAPPADAESAPTASEPMMTPDARVGDGRAVQLGLSLGWGFETSNSEFGPHPYNFGFGLRTGYTLDQGIFVGLSGTYFLGETSSNENSGGSVATGIRENSVSALLVGLEVGYDVWIGDAILRPSAEVGALVTFISNSTQFDGEPASYGAMYLAPGASLLFPIDEFYLGGDARMPIAFGDGQSTFTLMAMGGMRFEADWF